jgi:hypothetical protein
VAISHKWKPFSLPHVPDAGTRFGETSLLKDAADQDASEISDLNCRQTRQRPQCGRSAERQGRSKTFKKYDGHQTQQDADAKDGSRQNPDQKVNSDQIGQDAVARTGLRPAILAAKSLTRVEGSAWQPPVFNFAPFKY